MRVFVFKVNISKVSAKMNLKQQCMCLRCAFNVFGTGLRLMSFGCLAWLYFFATNSSVFVLTSRKMCKWNDPTLDDFICCSHTTNVGQDKHSQPIICEPFTRAVGQVRRLHDVGLVCGLSFTKSALSFPRLSEHGCALAFCFYIGFGLQAMLLGNAASLVMYILVRVF